MEEIYKVIIASAISLLLFFFTTSWFLIPNTVVSNNNEYGLEIELKGEYVGGEESKGVSVRK